MKLTRHHTLAAAAITAALLLGGEVADARSRSHRYDWFWNYYDEKWCLSAMTQLNECGYPTLELCNIARNGVGGSCNLNPRYVDRVLARASRKRW